MNKEKGSSPDNIFGVYLVNRSKRILLARDNMFELRKMEFKIKRCPETVLRIEGQDTHGTVHFNQQANLMDIYRNGSKIGLMVV